MRRIDKIIELVLKVIQVEAESDQRQRNADTANKHVKQASLNLDDIKGTVLFQGKSPLVMPLRQPVFPPTLFTCLKLL